MFIDARARPLPTAHVGFLPQAENGGTQVAMVEDLAQPLLNLIARPLGHALLRLRNRETLRRLKSYAEQAS